MKFSGLLGLFSTQKEFIGGIERLSPSSISGWFYSYKDNFDEVHLVNDSKIIAKSIFNVYRNDVNNKFNISGNRGFQIPLDGIKSEILNKSLFKLFAVNSNSSKKTEIKLFNNPNETSSTIFDLLNSNLLGREGHFDGIQDDGMITGWAGKLNSENSIEIWLQSKNLDPVKIFCDEWRDGMRSVNMQGFCGFSIDPLNFSNEWSEKEVYCSFDKSGKYKLSQNGEIWFPNISNLTMSDTSERYFDNYEESFLLSSEEIEKCWKSLNDLKILLDERL